MPFIQYFSAFFISVILSLAAAFFIKRLARKFNIIDSPSPPLKLHPKTIPLLGGIAIFLAFFVTILLLFSLDILYIKNIPPNPKYGWGGLYLFLGENSYPLKYILGIFFGALILAVGGVLDDKYRLKPLQQFFFPLGATLIIIASGIGIKAVTNPFVSLGILKEPVLNLEMYKIKLLTFQGIPYFFAPLSDLFTLIWLLGMIYTTKFLDGLDGLVSGIAVIGSIFTFIVSLTLGEPLIALLAVVLAGSFFGFLPWNFHPAKIFLGEVGSTLAGFLLGVFAIVGNTKVSITLLVMGIAVLDVLWIILRRKFYERRSPFLGDRKHLHFRLLDAGFSHRKAVLFLYLLSFAFGVLGLILQNTAQVYAFFTLLIVMLVLAIWVCLKSQSSRQEGNNIK